MAWYAAKVGRLGSKQDSKEANVKYSKGSLSVLPLAFAGVWGNKKRKRIYFIILTSLFKPCSSKSSCISSTPFIFFWPRKPSVVTLCRWTQATWRKQLSSRKVNSNQQVLQQNVCKQTKSVKLMSSRWTDVSVPEMFDGLIQMSNTSYEVKVTCVDPACSKAIQKWII